MLPPGKLSVSRVSKAGRPPFWVKDTDTVAVPVVPDGFGSKLVTCLFRPLKRGSTMVSVRMSLLERATPLTNSRARASRVAPAMLLAWLSTRTLNSSTTPSRSTSLLALTRLPRSKITVWLPSGLLITVTRAAFSNATGPAPLRSAVIGRASALVSLPSICRPPVRARRASLVSPPLLEISAMRRLLPAGSMNCRPFSSSMRNW
ncbi:hypothetical protein D3C78_1040550 [compost metagenome]